MSGRNAHASERVAMEEQDSIMVFPETLTVSTRRSVSSESLHSQVSSTAALWDEVETLDENLLFGYEGDDSASAICSTGNEPNVLPEFGSAEELEFDAFTPHGTQAESLLREIEAINKGGLGQNSRSLERVQTNIDIDLGGQSSSQVPLKRRLSLDDEERRVTPRLSAEGRRSFYRVTPSVPPSTSLTKESSTVTLVPSSSSGSTSHKLVDVVPAPSDTSIESPLAGLKPNTSCIYPAVADYDHDPFLNSNTDSTSGPVTDTSSIVVVVHSDAHQRFFSKLSWGVQWRIGMLITSGRLKYEDIRIDSLPSLIGSNASAAPLVEEVLCTKKSMNPEAMEVYNRLHSVELNTKTPWNELDIEEERLNRDQLSGLGLNGPDDDWYGGRVQFVIKMRPKGKGIGDAKSYSSRSPLEYSYTLEPPELGTSNRFARRWGSHCFIRVRLQEEKGGPSLVSHFANARFVVLGRVFKAFYAKDCVYLIQLKETYMNGMITPGAGGGILWEEFWKWHNPMEFNTSQSLSKWCSRTALGLSNSVPGVEFEPKNIIPIDDIYSPTGMADLREGRKPDAKDVMTDGCGYTSYSVLFALKRQFNLDCVPCAVQFRLGGAKGLLLLHPQDDGLSTQPYKAWIRPSQTKIAYDSSQRPDRAILVLDVLRTSHLKYPARLSKETIINLAENGVGFEAFKHLMTDSLTEVAASLTQWSGQYAMEELLRSVVRLGGVIRARMARQSGGSSRVLGFGYRDKDDGDDDDDDDDDSLDGLMFDPQSKAWWADEISGCPSTLEETVIVLLAAGFEPWSCPILAAKLREVFKAALKRRIDNFRIDVPLSLAAWAVPEPGRRLKAGQIFVKTSQPIKDKDGNRTDHLIGYVLVMRHPCKTPSDVQKVEAVWINEYRQYSDVAMFSTQGDRSETSLLAGGDQDGDTITIVYDPAIVNAFNNEWALKYADPPTSIDDAFEKDTLKVSDFLLSPDSTRLQSYLLGALKDPSLVGQYSTFHDVAVYRHGYASEEAWRLAYMFCSVLDASKTGKVVRALVLNEDRRRYNGFKLHWKEKKDAKPDQNREQHRQGSVSKVGFIMDQLKDSGQAQYDEHLGKYDHFVKDACARFKKAKGCPLNQAYRDASLVGPWERKVALAAAFPHSGLQTDLMIIERHVEDMSDDRGKMVQQDPSTDPLRSPSKKGATFSGKSIETRQDILRNLSLMFVTIPAKSTFTVLDQDDFRRLCASYAYIYEWKKTEGKSIDKICRFPFDVAMRELCHIKATAIGPSNTVTSRLFSVLNVVSAIQSFRSANQTPYTFEP